MVMNVTRYAELHTLLSDRRRDLQEDVQRRLRDEREDRSAGVGDILDASDAGLSGEVAFALLQLKADTLSRIDDAMTRLETGTFGTCVECGIEIAPGRLRALPFATRCTACEGAIERRRADAQRSARREASLALFAQAGGLQR